MYTGASENVSVVVSANDTSTRTGNRNAAICATEFLTTEIARSERPFHESTRPAAFSTALPAIATITSPANAWEMCSWSIDGCNAETNQSETNADAAPPTNSSNSTGRRPMRALGRTSPAAAGAGARPGAGAGPGAGPGAGAGAPM